MVFDGERDDSHEASSTIQPNLSVLDEINPYDEIFDISRSYGVTTAHVRPGTQNVISGKIAIIKTTGYVIEDMIIESDHG